MELSIQLQHDAMDSDIESKVPETDSNGIHIMIEKRLVDLDSRTCRSLRLFTLSSWRRYHHSPERRIGICAFPVQLVYKTIPIGLSISFEVNILRWNYGLGRKNFLIAPLLYNQGAMDVPKKLLRYRYHISIAVAVSLSLSFLLYTAPRILTILAYFWPLFASTIVLLVAIIAFGGVSKFSIEGHGEKAGGELLDYVALAGMSEHTEEAQNF
ncbi:hypothetical protein VNO77_06011 [Canavalia gladiata]|uniref:Uncharacterized protein n=1 Tax=Canavalia gladiata TaxID=3824 RepID=A0AAN9N037_CANGL